MVAICPGRQPANQAYAYDSRSQLVTAQTASPSSTLKTTTASSAPRVWRYHYDRNGNRVLTQENVPVAEMGQTRKATYDPASNAMLTPQTRHGLHPPHTRCRHCFHHAQPH